MQSETRYNLHRSRTVVDVGLQVARMKNHTIILVWKVVNEDRWLRMYLTEEEALKLSDGLQMLITGAGSDLLVGT